MKKVIRKPGRLERIASIGGKTAIAAGIALPLATLGLNYASRSMKELNGLGRLLINAGGLQPVREFCDTYGTGENAAYALAGGIGLTGLGLLYNGAARVIRNKREAKNKRVAKENNVIYET